VATFSGSLPCELLYYSALLCYVWLNKPSSSSSSSIIRRSSIRRPGNPNLVGPNRRWHVGYYHAMARFWPSRLNDCSRCKTDYIYKLAHYAYGYVFHANFMKMKMNNCERHKLTIKRAGSIDICLPKLPFNLLQTVQWTVAQWGILWTRPLGI